jgi:hypothetical protein
MDIYEIIKHCRRDARCIGGIERRALCDAVEERDAKIERLERELFESESRCDAWALREQELEAEVRRVQDKIALLDGAVVASYRAWVQESGSSQFVKDEAAALVRAALNADL